MPPKRHAKRGNVTQPPPLPKNTALIAARHRLQSRPAAMLLHSYPPSEPLEATVSVTMSTSSTETLISTTFVPVVTLQHLVITSETHATTFAQTTQLPLPQTQQLISQQTNVVQLLTI